MLSTSLQPAFRSPSTAGVLQVMCNLPGICTCSSSTSKNQLTSCRLALHRGSGLGSKDADLFRPLSLCHHAPFIFLLSTVFHKLACHAILKVVHVLTRISLRLRIHLLNSVAAGILFRFYFTAAFSKLI